MPIGNQGHRGIRVTDKRSWSPSQKEVFWGKKHAFQKKPKNQQRATQRTGDFDLFWIQFCVCIWMQQAAKQTELTTFQVGTKLCFVIFLFVFQFISHWSASINDHFICCWQIRKLDPILSFNISTDLSGAVLITSEWISPSSLLHEVDFRVSICRFRLKKPQIYPVVFI